MASLIGVGISLIMIGLGEHGVYGKRGEYIDYFGHFKGEEVRVVREDIRYGHDRLYITIGGYPEEILRTDDVEKRRLLSRIVRGEIATDEGKIIKLKTGDNRYEIYDALQAYKSKQ